MFFSFFNKEIRALREACLKTLSVPFIFFALSPFSFGLAKPWFESQQDDRFTRSPGSVLLLMKSLKELLEGLDLGQRFLMKHHRRSLIIDEECSPFKVLLVEVFSESLSQTRVSRSTMLNFNVWSILNEKFSSRKNAWRLFAASLFFKSFA